METLLTYFIKASALIALFFLAYYIFLRKETFFKSNRWFLLFGLVSSVLLPTVTFKKTIWVDPVPVEVSNIDYPEIPVAPTPAMNEIETVDINWFWIIGIVYGIGILILLVKFAIDFHALKKVLNGKTIQKQEDYKFVNVSENISPFSYFNYIVYNPELYSEKELENILEHEKVHCSQNHTIDVLISRIFAIIFWWNPFMWLYKKAIVQNLEFIADSDASKKISDKKAYQFMLLKITTHDSCVAISNHFYQSLIKKRIVMLNKNQSKKSSSWKYGIVLPVLAFFMLQFQVDVVAQQRENDVITTNGGGTISSDARDIIEMSWNKDTSDEEFKKDAEAMKAAGLTMKFSKIKRNPKGEITAIKISYKDNLGNQETKQISGSEPIKPIAFIRNIDPNGKGEIGFHENAALGHDADKISGDGVIYADVIDVHEDIDVAFEHPEPPTPPTPPAAPNYPAPPATPNFPTPPTPPNAPKSDSNKKEWKDFEKEMEQFKTEMNSEEIQKFKEEMKEYAMEMASMNVESDEFKEEMKEFQKEMMEFQKEMAAFNRQVQHEIRTEVQKERESAQKERESAQKEREEARKIRDKERAVAEKAREKAKKAREAAQK